MRLFVSDLDGTLLHRDGTLSDYARDALNRMIEAGLMFTVASARSAFSMRRILDGLHLPLPVIEHNGAYVTRLWEDQTLVSRPMCRDTGEALLSAGRAQGLSPVISTLGEDGQRIYVPMDDLNEGQRWFHEDRRRAGDTRVRPHDLPHALPDDTLMGLNFIAKREALEALEQLALRGPVKTYLYENNYNPGWHWLTVHAREATKAHGLRFVAEHLGVPMSEVTVFGDEINDLPMFDAAGEAIAVDNAVPAVKQAAARVLGLCDDDAVVRYLEGVVEGR